MMVKAHDNEKGITLIVTLWVIVVLSVVTMAYIQQVNLEVKMVGFQRDVTVADSLALAGLRQALILLREDRIKDSGEEIQETITQFMEDDTFQYDGGTEAWSDNPELYIDVPFYKLRDKGGYFYVEVEDESAKLPINNRKVTLDMIAHLLELTGVPEREALPLAGAIVDWRDRDDVPSEGVADQFGGGEDEYSVYNSGEGRRKRGRGREGDSEMPKFTIKNGPFDSIDELLLVPGFTPDIVYGTVDPDEGRSRGRTRRRRMGKGEYYGLKHYVSVYTGQVNLNTVKLEVMESILFPAMGKEAEKLAIDWIEYRDGRDGLTYTDDDKVLKTMGNEDGDDVHFTEVDGFTGEVIKQIMQIAGVSSETFIVVSLAEYEGIEKGYRAVVRRNFIPWDRLPIFGMDTQNVEDLEQVSVQVRLIEPIYDVGKKIDELS